MGQHAVDDVVDPLRLDDRQQRVLGAEGVPQRHGRVVLESLRGVRLVIQPAIAAVGVVIQRRRQAGVIQGRIKRLPGGRIDAVSTSIFPSTSCPTLPRRGGHAVEIPAGDLLCQVLPGGLHAHRGNADFHQDRLAGLNSYGLDPLSLHDARRG